MSGAINGQGSVGGTPDALDLGTREIAESRLEALLVEELRHALLRAAFGIGKLVLVRHGQSTWNLENLGKLSGVRRIKQNES